MENKNEVLLAMKRESEHLRKAIECEERYLSERESELADGRHYLQTLSQNYHELQEKIKREENVQRLIKEMKWEQKDLRNKESIRENLDLDLYRKEGILLEIERVEKILVEKDTLTEKYLFTLKKDLLTIERDIKRHKDNLSFIEKLSKRYLSA